MKVNHHLDVPSQPVDMAGSSGCRVRWLVGKPEGAPNFAMRQFEVAPGGYTPKHSHPYEHEVFVLEGNGVVLEDRVEHRLQAGDVIFVAPGDIHQFRNTGRTPLKFLCLVPHIPEGTPVTQAPECGMEK